MEKIKTILKEIDSVKSELDSLRPFDADRLNKVEQTFRLWWNYHSNAIEGNQLTLGETKMLLMHGLTAKGKPLKDHEDVKGHNDVILLLNGIVAEKRPLNETLIRELHKALLREPYPVKAITPDGKETTKMIKIGDYKTLPNNVKTPTGEIHYYVSPEETPAQMTDLVDWYHQAEKDQEHPVLIAAQFHYKFVCIHPFDDGNGRMSRILMNLILIKHGYVPAILRIEERNTNYIPSLVEADLGDNSNFLEYITQCELDSITKYLKGIKGENIDEPDDLQKRFALLDKRISGLEGERGRHKNLKVLRDQYENWIGKFFTAYDTIFVATRQYFKSSKIILRVHDNASNPMEFGDTVNFLANVYNLLNDSTSSIYTEFVFQRFDKAGLRPFDCVVSVEIRFMVTEYILNCATSESSVKKSYLEYLTEEEINKIIQKEGKALTELIDKNIDEVMKS